MFISAHPRIPSAHPRIPESYQPISPLAAPLVFDRPAVEAGEPLKGWKRSPVAWLVYLVSHESHHRGQIAQALKQSGVRPPQEVSLGVWGYWGGCALKEPSG